MPLKNIQLLQASYNGSKRSGQIQNKLSNAFPIQIRVCQGDVVFALLFSIMIDAILQKGLEDRHRVQYDVNNVIFLDPSAIFAETDAEATNIMWPHLPVLRPKNQYG